ncbi:uncharacterized protein BDV17DRAFT_37748 [Aspergillus undulatus]|uniref:uncharacterized protein n=1 Tax=Aspergillus undulatus TaxID=1810928 RepID=UPI003CCD5A61
MTITNHDNNNNRKLCIYGVQHLRLSSSGRFLTRFLSVSASSSRILYITQNVHTSYEHKIYPHNWWSVNTLVDEPNSSPHSNRPRLLCSWLLACWSMSKASMHFREHRLPGFGDGPVALFCLAPIIPSDPSTTTTQLLIAVIADKTNNKPESSLTSYEEREEGRKTLDSDFIRFERPPPHQAHQASKQRNRGMTG